MNMKVLKLPLSLHCLGIFFSSLGFAPIRFASESKDYACTFWGEWFLQLHFGYFTSCFRNVEFDNAIRRLHPHQKITCITLFSIHNCCQKLIAFCHSRAQSHTESLQFLLMSHWLPKQRCTSITSASVPKWARICLNGKIPHEHRWRYYDRRIVIYFSLFKIISFHPDSSLGIFTSMFRPSFTDFFFKEFSQWWCQSIVSYLTTVPST